MDITLVSIPNAVICGEIAKLHCSSFIEIPILIRSIYKNNITNEINTATYTINYSVCGRAWLQPLRAIIFMHPIIHRPVRC
jgi:hypothetical protein